MEAARQPNSDSGASVQDGRPRNVDHGFIHAELENVETAREVLRARVLASLPSMTRAMIAAQPGGIEWLAKHPHRGQYVGRDPLPFEPDGALGAAFVLLERSTDDAFALMRMISGRPYEGGALLPNGRPLPADDPKLVDRYAEMVNALRDSPFGDDRLRYRRIQARAQWLIARVGLKFRSSKIDDRGPFSPMLFCIAVSTVTENLDAGRRRVARLLRRTLQLARPVVRALLRPVRAFTVRLVRVILPYAERVRPRATGPPRSTFLELLPILCPLA